MPPARNKRGQLLPGNTANPKGRPTKAKEESYLAAFTSVVTLEGWKKVIKKAETQARGGDKDARKFLADYIVGPPIQRVLDPMVVQNPYAGMTPEELVATAKKVLKRVKIRI